MSTEELLFETEARMEKAVDHLKKSYRGIRTGRATPALVEHIKVDAYGAETPIKQIANIAAPESNLLVIKPYDPNLLEATEKAIMTSDIGIHPQNDGKVIRLVIPPLSEERRKKFVSQARELAEEARVSIRNIRRDANKEADTLEKEQNLSEDVTKRVKDKINDLIKDYEKKVDDLLEAKTEELMSV